MSVCLIWMGSLDLKNILARLVPIKFSLKVTLRTEISLDMLNPENFVSTFMERIITCDGIWTYAFEMQTSQQSSEVS